MQRLRHLEFDFIIIYKSMVNLLKTWWTFSSFGNTERKAHRFIFLYVGVLTHNYNLQVAKLCFRKGIEDEILGRVASTTAVFFGDVSVERAE